MERLNKKMTSAGAEFELLMQVEAVADPWWGEYAFAKLVAWDTLWDLIMLGAVGLESFTVSLMDDIPCDKNPYELAHKKKNMVFEKCGAMIVEEGMGKNTRNLVYPSEATGYYTITTGKPYSEKTAELIDAEVKALSDEAAVRAENVLKGEQITVFRIAL